MIFLLTSVSTVMILGGGALAFYGADTIRTESGATLALAGVALFCTGFILLALSRVLSELRRLRRVVEEPEQPAVAPLPQAAPPPPVVRPPPPNGAMPPPPPGMAPPPVEQELTPAERLKADRQAADAAPEVTAEKPAGVGEATEAPFPSSERTLTATYNSGGNTFYMYSDGTIETVVPSGRYRFGSMEELRVFIENGTGGERVEPSPETAA